MKTTRDLDDDLITDAEVLAAQQCISPTRLIEEGLQLRLCTKTPPARRAVALPVLDGHGGRVPGIEPLSNEAMLKALDRDDA